MTKKTKQQLAGEITTIIRGSIALARQGIVDAISAIDRPIVLRLSNMMLSSILLLHACQHFSQQFSWSKRLVRKRWSREFQAHLQAAFQRVSPAILSAFFRDFEYHGRSQDGDKSSNWQLLLLCLKQLQDDIEHIPQYRDRMQDLVVAPWVEAGAKSGYRKELPLLSPNCYERAIAIVRQQEHSKNDLAMLELARVYANPSTTAKRRYACLMQIRLHEEMGMTYNPAYSALQRICSYLQLAGDMKLAHEWTCLMRSCQALDMTGIEATWLRLIDNIQPGDASAARALFHFAKYHVSDIGPAVLNQLEAMHRLLHAGTHLSTFRNKEQSGAPLIGDYNRKGLPMLQAKCNFLEALGSLDWVQLQQTKTYLGEHMLPQGRARMFAYTCWSMRLSMMKWVMLMREMSDMNAGPLPPSHAKERYAWVRRTMLGMVKITPVFQMYMPQVGSSVALALVRVMTKGGILVPVGPEDEASLVNRLTQYQKHHKEYQRDHTAMCALAAHCQDAISRQDQSAQQCIEQCERHALIAKADARHLRYCFEKNSPIDQTVLMRIERKQADLSHTMAGQVAAITRLQARLDGLKVAKPSGLFARWKSSTPEQVVAQEKRDAKRQLRRLPPNVSERIIGMLRPTHTRTGPEPVALFGDNTVTTGHALIQGEQARADVVLNGMRASTAPRDRVWRNTKEYMGLMSKIFNRGKDFFNRLKCWAQAPLSAPKALPSQMLLYYRYWSADARLLLLISMMAALVFFILGLPFYFYSMSFVLLCMAASIVLRDWIIGGCKMPPHMQVTKLTAASIASGFTKHATVQKARNDTEKLACTGQTYQAILDERRHDVDVRPSC